MGSRLLAFAWTTCGICEQLGNESPDGRSHFLLLSLSLFPSLAVTLTPSLSLHLQTAEIK